MGLMDRVKEDIKRITSDTNAFAKSIVVTDPDTSQSVTISGLHTKINLAVDTDGNNVNSRKAHVSFSESALTDAGFATRDADGVVNLKGKVVTVVDSTGQSVDYIIRETYPDETIGLIVCIIGAYQDFEN